MMRGYIDAVRKRNELSDLCKNKKIVQWVKWAEEKVDWYDPLINLTNSDFINVDKETLEFKSNISEYGFYS